MSLMQFFSEKRIMSDLKNICDRARWMTTPKITEAAQYMVDKLNTIPGLKNVELVELPSDGKTAFGGWVMPKAWDVKSASLTLLDRQTSDDCPKVLADYQTNPFSLMMWSPPTPSAGLKAPVVIIDNPLDPKTDLSSVKGKFVLLGSNTCSTALIALANAGAVGLLSDWVVLGRESKKGPYLDEATQWWNYVNPQWDGEARLPAFALTPNVGRKLRALIAARGSVKLHAKVNSRLYDGTFPLVTARLSGKRADEIVLTAHMDEPGASDNASGTALAMEIMRSLAEYVAARNEPLEFGIRLFCSVEARGLQAYLNTNTKYGRNGSGIVASLNLDMLAYDHTAGRTRLDIFAAQPSMPSMLEVLLREEAAKEAKRKPAFGWMFKPEVVVDDCQFAGHPFSAPTFLLVQAPDKTYHCSLDTVENLSESHVRRVGRIVLDALTPMLKPELKVLEKIGKRVLAHAQAELQNPESKRAIAAIIDEAEKNWRDMLRYLPESGLPLNAEELEKKRKTLLRGHLLPHYVLEAQIGEWSHTLRKTKAKPRPVSKIVVPKIPPALAKVARSLVPLKLFAGYLAFEDLHANPARRQALKDRTGLQPGWSVASWLQWSLDIANGKRTLLELYETVSPNHKLDLKIFIEIYRFLQEDGKVRFRPIVTKKEVQAAIQNVGIKRGDIVVAHSSLSDFGYLEGGSDTLIDTLLKIVGPKGTLCMPTHSLNWVGKAPYDPKTSPSFTGAVPKAFLKRKGVLRSAHPTHSVAAFGPAAKALMAKDGPHLAPQARDGFWGKFVDAGGKVLMLCKLGSNTLLHGGEIWAGTPYRPGVTHVLKKGKREESVTPGMPWHVHTFVPVHERLSKKSLLPSAPLGESVIHSMQAQDAIAEMMQYVKENPLAPISEKCRCIFCEYMRKKLGVELLKK